MEPDSAGPVRAAPGAPAPPAKRQRFQVALLEPCDSDLTMTDVAPGGPLKLQQLPLDAAKHILRHLHDTPAAPSPTYQWLRTHAPLRTVCVLLRDAFDAHLTSFDLVTVPAPALPALLGTFLARLPALSALLVQGSAGSGALAGAWRGFFGRTRARVTDLTFAVRPDAPGVEAAAAALAEGAAASLEELSTTSAAMVRRAADACAHVRAVHVGMDGGADAADLARFPGLRTARLLYRRGIGGRAAERLVAALRACAALASVELRVNNVRVGELGFLARVPRLRKVAVFDGAVEGGGARGMDVFAQCAFLEEVELEWMRGLSAADVAALARGLGARLRRLRLWNCEDVRDDGLAAVAACCPNAEVDLRFERDQFGAATLALFGDRVTWGSYSRFGALADNMYA